MTWVELLLKMIGDDDAEPAAVAGVITSRAGTDSSHDRVGWMTSDRVRPPLINARRTSPPGTGGSTGVRVWRDGEHLRVEELDGRVVLIADDDTVWAFDDDDPRPRELPRERLVMSAPGVGIGLSLRRSAEDWVSGGIRQVASSRRPVRGPVRPTGPVLAVTFLGRPAWEVELELLQGAPGPVQLVVDDQTGLFLQRRCDSFDSVDQWTEFAVHDTLDRDMFSWGGAVRPIAELQAAAARAGEAERIEQQQWFAEHVTGEPLTVETELSLHGARLQPDGSFSCLL